MCLIGAERNKGSDMTGQSPARSSLVCMAELIFYKVFVGFYAHG